MALKQQMLKRLYGLLQHNAQSRNQTTAGIRNHEQISKV